MTFSDETGRRWSLRLTVRTLGRIRRVCGQDLGQVLWSESNSILTDLEGYARLMWAIVRPQAQRADLSEQEFAERLTSLVMARSAVALEAAVIEFMPESRDADEETERQIPDLERLSWELAGAVGIDPRPYTMRQLVQMVRGRERLTWNQFAAVVFGNHKTMTGEPNGLSLRGLFPRWLFDDPDSLTKLTPEEEKARSDAAFDLLGKALREHQERRQRRAASPKENKGNEANDG